MAETEYRSHYDGTYSLHRSDADWHPSPHIPPETVYFDDVAQVATCLIENGDYNGQQLMASFSEDDVLAFATEDARRIVEARRQSLNERQELRHELQAAMARVATNHEVRTVYIVQRSVAS